MSPETKQQPKSGTKEKRRNNEKRKEKSRDAARCRRSRETEIFADLAGALPITQEQVSQLDKASIMRLAISYLRVRDMVNLIPANQECEEETTNDDESIFLKSLEGFLLVLSSEGDFIYISDNVSDYLGIAQIDLMGQNIYDYSHPCDHEEIKELLSTKSKQDQRSFFVRLKCTLTSKGRSVNLKSASYKVMNCKGHMLRSEDNKMKLCFAAIASPIPHPSNIEAPLPKQTFITKHSLDMKFVHADDEIMKEVMGYQEDELLGKSLYEYHHAMDSDSICSAYKCLFSKGQCETGKYRFLAKNGGYVWVLTQATLIYDKMQKPQSVVCVNYIISGVERDDEVYSAAQLSCSQITSAIETTTADEEDDDDELDYSTKIDSKNIVLLDESLLLSAETSQILLREHDKSALLSASSQNVDSPHGPKRNTQKILTPRTEEMNRGFLTFAEDSGITMLKDEPDDLTHLAPVAGDVCVPLGEHPFLSDVLDDIFLKDNFTPLILDEPSDPFIAYRDTYDVSPDLLSPNHSKNSESSFSSVNSPSNSLPEDDHMSFMSYSFDEDKKDSYIPMNMDDLPLLLSSSNDLMWSNGSSPTPPSPKAVNASSLAQLLASSEQIDPTKRNDRIISSNKRSLTTTTNVSTKRVRTEMIEEPKEDLSSELLQQLMTNKSQGRPKKNLSCLMENDKATCVSQPSDSVLMNLLDNGSVIEKKVVIPQASGQNIHRYLIRVNSKSLIKPETAPISSFLTLTDQDYEVNAPVNNNLLQGEDLIKALEICDAI